LLLYAYLPLRWQTVVGEPMGYGRFVDWVIGGRFQGALQLMAWLRDPTRYDVVSRLFVENWGWFNLGVALVGLIMLLWQRRQAAVVLLLTWFGYAFYCLNYYVPDLAVFLLPAQIVVGIWWAFGLVAIVDAGSWALKIKRVSFSIRAFVLVLLLVPTLLHVVAVWPQVDQSADDGQTRWGTAVLAQPLAENSAILADSDKYPPLYYLQQTEGIRPDLDISVWPDEAAYREQLTARLAAGQPVYLARFLPGLEGSYHLRSMGPLTEVSTSGLTAVPAEAALSEVAFDGIRLLGYVLEPDAAVAAGQTAVTFYWQTAAPLEQVLHVYVRWSGEAAGNGQHPANNNYPTVAWEPGEVVSDYHLLPQPVLTQAETRRLQVALAPPFTPPDALDWQTVAEVALPPTPPQALERPFRIQSDAAMITGASIPAQSRPQKPLPVLVSGIGDPEAVSFSLAPMGREPLAMSRNSIAAAPADTAYLLADEVETDVGNGRYQLVASDPSGMICGWMQPLRQGCVLSEVDISGVALVDGATNFEDKIALLSVEIENPVLQPGGQLRLALHWQSLAALDENYTVFVQVLDAQDRIVGQMDAWPLQGTYPTTAWTPGEQVTDPYVVQLDGVLSPGAYRLQVGWYLLATVRRLPV
ncbi:MAG: hypothetical protein KC421_09950, partial [Anaerolineales bacterium]|nr:hypothetical protein [Anaerolineales bacterium]